MEPEEVMNAVDAVRLRMGVTKARAKSAVERFWARVERGLATEDCWQWRGKLNDKGYGILWIRPKPAGPTKAHRFAYELLIGPIPKGLEPDHRCRNRRCVNPDHLELVTHQVNLRRGEGGLIAAIRQRQKKHCAQGHAYDLINTYFTPDGRRECRICKQNRSQLSKRRVRDRRRYRLQVRERRI